MFQGKIQLGSTHPNRGFGLIIFWIFYFPPKPCGHLQKFRLLVDLIIVVRSLFCYSNYIVYEPNMHNPVSGRRVYLRSFTLSFSKQRKCSA